MRSQKEGICDGCGELIEDCICDQEELEAAAEVYDKAVQDEEAFGYFRGDNQTITPRQEKECFAGMTDRELHAYKRILGNFNKNTIFVGPAGKLDRHRKMVAKEIVKRTRRNEKRRQDLFDRCRATAEAEKVVDECLDC